MFKNEFERYALSSGISSLKLHQYNQINSSYMSPIITEERHMNVAQMDVFSRLMMERIIFMGCPVVDDVANIIQAQLLFLESADPKKDVSIYINSPGGSVSAGLGIYDTMQLVSCDINTTCAGLAASMGAVLLAGGTEGKRFSLRHSKIMIHQPLISGGLSGQASDIEISAREIVKTKRVLYDILAYHTKKSVEEIEKDSDRDYWLTSNEALDYGLIDKILEKR